MKNWDDLKIVLALSRYRTMTAAAKSLDLNTGTVSRRLEKFTEEVGKTLFIRRGNDWEPTPTALPMIRAAEQFDTNVSAKNFVDAAEVKSETFLRLSADPEIMADAIAPNLSKFLSSNPSTKLDLVEVEMSVALGDSDLSISFREPMAGRLVRSKIGEIRYNSFYNRKWQGGPKGYIEYVSEDRRPTNCNVAMREQFGSATVTTRGLNCAMGVLNELPLAMCMPCRFAGLFPDLVPVDGNIPCTRFSVWAAFHESRRLDPDVRLALDFIRNCFSE